MRVYLSSPGQQMQADHCRGMAVLLSFGKYRKVNWIESYYPSFGRCLLDSGAFSELGGMKIDVDEYAEWANRFPGADAVAALDDISGDHEKSVRNWERYPWMFPTFHDTDPWEVLDYYLGFNPSWIGLGMKPPRTSTIWLDETLDRIPEGIHVHGWALRAFTDRARLDSVDSTNWFRDSWQVKNAYPWLTPAEALEIVVKRYQRENRIIKTRSTTPCLFDTQ